MSVPKLRFKEFDGDWSIKPLKNICKINQGLQIAIENRFTDDGVNRYFYITNEFLREGAKKTYFIENPPRNVICDENDILMTRTGNTGQVVTDVKGAFHNNFFKIDFDRSIINKNFFIEFLKKDTTQHLILKYAGASTIPDLNHSDFYRIVMPITTIKEQTKISSFLSNVDEKISQLTQKHALLSQYKQGMMQKLFSQQLRFKADDGSEFGEWKETSLHTFLCESLIKGSKGNKAKKLTVKLWGKGVIPKNEAFQGSENTQYYKRSAGQLIYGKLDFLNCAFGLIPEYLDGFESTIDAPAFDIDNKIVHPYFLINRFLQKDFYQKNGEEADGSRKAKRINQSVFLAMQIDLPSLEEQTKIANFLSAIDQKIEVVTQQIEQAKTWKKGLLQQMFV